ncbi:MAG: metal-dependent hydrolase [Firmicutes bacterium]|nr:metal-dependent hydrolase [Bacillota bacterium]
MLWRTHFFIGTSIGFMLTQEPSIVLTCAGISGLASLLPDIDEPNSWIGVRMPVIPAILKSAAGHRGVMHSLVAAAGISLLAFLSLKNPLYSVSLLLGYLSHLVLDSLNPSGVPWLYPYKKCFSLPLVKTGGALERFLVVPASFALFCSAAYFKLL